jgi:triacylglycerol esterase/lipase EstA (alpha/beta hydrolase family)
VSDHDFEVFFPGFVAPSPPNRSRPSVPLHALVRCTIDALNSQFTGPDKTPRPIPVSAGGQTFTMTFDDVTFFPMPKEEFETARLNLSPPVSDSGSDATGDLGLGRQQLLLKWLLEGQYVWLRHLHAYEGSDGSNLLQGRDLDTILAKLTSDLIPLEEGYEWARLQEYNLIKSKAYIRIKGASNQSSAFYDWYVKQLHDAGKAGIRSALARMVADARAQMQVLGGPLDLAQGATARITRSAYQMNACYEVNPGTDPAGWDQKGCTSFEEYIVAAAIKDFLARREVRRGAATLQLLFDIPVLLDLHRFYRVKSDLETIPSEQEADRFIAAVARFIEKVQVETEGIHGALVLPCDQPPACNPDPMFAHLYRDRIDRNDNIQTVDERREAALKKGTLHIVPRLFNASFRDADDVELVMHRDDVGVSVRRVRVSVQPNTEQFRDYPPAGGGGPPQETRDLAERNTDDESSRVRPPVREEEFLLGDKTNPTGNPPIPLDTRYGAQYGVPHWVAFTIDLRERKLRESNRQNNVGGFFYYILDRTTANPVPPATAQHVPLPPALSATTLTPNPECSDPPKLTMFQSATPARITFTVRNVSNAAVTDVTVFSTVTNQLVSIGTLAPNQERSVDVSFTMSPTVSTLSSVATVTGLDPDGNGVTLVSTQQLLDVASPIKITLYDASPLSKDLSHPFSRYLISHKPGSSDPRPISGAVTDGTEGSVRIAIEGLAPGAAAALSLADGDAYHISDGIGSLAPGAPVPGAPSPRFLHLTVTADSSGRAEAFYTPPDYFLRPSQKDDFDRVERQVELTVHQNNGPTSAVDISLRRPPVFLVHGLFGSIGVWDEFRPLLPESSYPKISRGWPLNLTDAKYFETRPGWEGQYGPRFDLFNVGSEYPTQNLAEETRTVRQHIALSLFGYRTGYAIGKIDLVAHSMGGMMSRKMIGEDARVRDAVRKLIIINSPLRGSPLADKVVATRDLVETLLSQTPRDPWNPVWLGAPPPEVKDNLCYNALQAIGHWRPFNIFNGAIDDLQTNSGEVTNLQSYVSQGLTVPTHHLVTSTTGADLSYSADVRMLWASLGLFCNWTPDANTVNLTQLLKVGAEAAKQLAGSVVAFLAKLDGASALGFLAGAKNAYDGLEIGLDPPTPIFSSIDNDRVVPLSSQLEGLSPGDPSVTEVFGATDHQDIKLTTGVTVERCVDRTSGVPQFHTPATVPDLDRDGQPDAVCHVIELLELDPKKPKFKK